MQVPKELAKYGLRSPSTPKRRRLVLGVMADTGAGKSSFGLGTMPKPLLVVNLDRNLEGIEERFLADDVLIYDVEMPDKIDEDADLKQFKEVRQIIMDSIAKRLFRSILIDTGDAMWEVCRRGFLGTLDFGGASRQDFTEANSAMRRIYRAAKAQKEVNLMVTHRVTEERIDYVTDKGKKASRTTGNMVQAGWKHTRFEVQAMVYLQKSPNWECQRSSCKRVCTNPAKHRLDRFTATITKCTANERCEGEVLKGEDITFANIGMLVFPATQDTPEVWEDGL